MGGGVPGAVAGCAAGISLGAALAVKLEQIDGNIPPPKSPPKPKNP